MSREGRSWQRVSAWLAGLVSCLVVAIATAQVAVPDPEQDPRLRTPITLAEPAISLGELCTTLTRQTKVRLSVSSGWRETRVVAYVPNRPLHELMANLPKVAPQLEWQVFRTSEGRFTYHLRATRPDPPLPAPTTEAEIVRRARAFVETLRKALREPDKKLIAQVKRFAQLQNELGSTPGDKAPALRRELASLEPYLVAAIYKGLIEPETYMPVEQEAIQWAVPLLLSLQANEWSLLQWGGQITVSASQHPAYPRRWVAQYRAQEIRAAKEAIESAEDEEARAHALEHKAHMEQITDVWVCAYVDDRLTVALRPVVGGELGGSIYEKVFEVARYAVPNEPKEILLERYGALPEFEIPDEPIFRQPFPETPDWIRKKANWYNELGCLLLEGAAAINRPLLAIHYPFSTDSGWQAYARLARNWADLFEKLPMFTHLVPQVEGDWLLFAHARPWSARRGDVPDSLLQRVVPMPEEDGWIYFDKVALAAKLLSIYQKQALAETLDRFPLTRRYLLDPRRDPADSGVRIAFSDMAWDATARIVWQLYHSLAPAQQARLRNSEPISIFELNAYQQYLCWRAVTSQPFQMGLSALPSPIAFIQLRYDPEVGEPRPLLPPVEVMRRIFEAENHQSASQAYQAWLQSLTPQERARLERLHRSELWSLEVWWGEGQLVTMPIMRHFGFFYPSFYNPLRPITDEEED